MGDSGAAMAARAGPVRLLHFGVRLTDQVWPGDTLTVRASAGLVDDRGDEPVAQFSVSTVAASMADGDGRAVVSGYSRARVARCRGIRVSRRGGIAAHGAAVPGEDLARG
jgi:hypothetical protein